MPCLLAVLIVAFPRVAIVLLYLFTAFFTGVYDSILLPLLGFLFLPFTLIAYTFLANMRQPHDTTFLVVMLIAVIADLGLIGGSNHVRRRR
ncbi:MAG: hypothetical protein ABJF23_06875 [Bryobacteraceae bacterium]